MKIGAFIHCCWCQHHYVCLISMSLTVTHSDCTVFTAESLVCTALKTIYTHHTELKLSYYFYELQHL